MSEKRTPPRWADRFLSWYCNPEILEEIQGDAHELYYDRLKRKGEIIADLCYLWDVIQFCRISNIRRPAEYDEPGAFRIFWNLNLKMAIRNSLRNRTIFIAKLSALAICLAFTFLLTGFVINELSYDHHTTNYDRIYRIGTRAEMQGKVTSYAVSPLPLAPAVASEVTGIERGSRFMISGMMYKKDDQKFYDIISYVADSNFLRMFNYEFISGAQSALDDPNHLVLTESLAMRLFGSTDVTGKTIQAGPYFLDVAGVIADPPITTHMTFQALISWNTFDNLNDSWDNINAYSYIQLQPGVDIQRVDSAVSVLGNDYLAEVAEEYDLKYDPIIQRIDEIHLAGFLDEDFAPKRSRNYVYIVISVIVLFMLTGLFNYLNLALAELSMQIRKIAILRTFGGVQADHRKVAITDSILCLVIVAPFVVFMMTAILGFPGFIPAIDPNVWTSRFFIGFVAAVIVSILVFSSLNSIVISRNEITLTSSGSGQKGYTVRKFLVAAQLSFSIIMIGLIIVIVDQFEFVHSSDKGFVDKDVIVVQHPGYRELPKLAEAIRGMSGVKMVAGVSFYPDGSVETKDIFNVETRDGLKNQLVNYIYGDWDYASLLGLRLKKGRFFDRSHSTDGGGGAYLINETAAREFGWEDPVGKKIEGSLNSDGPGVVVGVVEDFYFESMHSRVQPLIIAVVNEFWNVDFLYVKTEPLHSDALIDAIERKYNEMLPEIPFTYEYLDARYRGLYKHDYEIRDIFRSGLIVSILVSALGIFSISALLLSLRTKEMGIRKVVGADNAQLFWMHLKPFVVFFVIATAIGLPVIFYLSRKWLDNFAYHIDIDLKYFVLPGLVTVLIIVSASLYHAIKGSRINPVEILKVD